MQTFLLLATAYAVAFDPVPKAEPLPPITEKMWDQSASQLKQIALAIHEFHDFNGFLPHDVKDAKGKPMLSWRVQILPMMQQKELYYQFKLNEAWDSEHNKKLIEKMPKLYAPVRAKAEAGQTFYQGFAGEDTIFRKGKRVRFAEITDGLSNTAMVVEAGKAVPWTKPEDIPFDPNKDIPKLGAEFDGQFNMLLGDGSVMKVKKNYDADTLKLVIQMNDGRVINMDAITKE